MPEKSFADLVAQLLRLGHSVRFRAKGQSMHPTIRDGERITAKPADPADVRVSDIILYRAKRGLIAHRVVEMRSPEHSSLITSFIVRGDGSDSADEPVEGRQVLGKVVSVERNRRNVMLAGPRAKIARALRPYGSRFKRWISPLVASILFLACMGLQNSPAFAQTTFVQDTFTGTNGTSLASHNPDIGDASSWVKISGSSDLNIQSNHLQNTADRDTIFYKNTTAPTGGSDAYVVVIDGTWNDDKPDDIVGLMGRVSGASNDRYQVQIDGSGSSNVKLQKVVSGVTTTLATGSSTVCCTTKTIRLVIKDALKSVTINGTQIVSSTDNSINVAGVAGLLESRDSSVTTTTDNFGAATFNATAVKLISFTAASGDEGVLLRWRTGYEVNNLGFHIYREQDGERVRLTPDVIGGSALLARHGATLTAGYSYSWLDKSLLSPQSSSLETVRYWLEDIDLNGTRTWHGPIEVQQGAGSAEQGAFASTRRLSQLGKEKTATNAAQSSNESRPYGFPSLIEHEPTQLKPTQRQLLQQWELAGRPAIKLSVRRPGWYRVGQPELVAAGLNRNVDPRTLQLFVDGEEQAIVVTGAQDRRFNPRDTIEFYGEGLDIPSTDTRVYWLVWGREHGKRIDVVGNKRGTPAPTSFPYTIENKERTIYFAALKNGDAENFFGPVVGMEPVEEILNVLHLDPTRNRPVLEVALQGVTAGPHQVQLSVNGTPVGVVTFDGQDLGIGEVSMGSVHERENILTLVAQGGETDVSLIDYIRLTYWHTNTADANALWLTTDAGRQVTISGFTSSQIRVVDVTNPSAVVQLATMVNQQGSQYAATVTTIGHGTRALLAFTDARIEKPATITANQPSRWHRVERGVELVMIAHGNFLPSLEPLAALRRAQGRSVAVIDVEDLYDEFSFGHKNPQALKDFLAHTRLAWRKSPKFLLLVGGASFDPRNYLGLGEFDFVPTKLIDTAFLETASDDWFADFDGDGIPSLAVGRLPVHTQEEADTVVAKIVGYEQAAGHQREAVVVADKSDDFDFEGLSNTVADLLPAALSVREVFRGQSDDAATRTELLSSLNAGPLLVNYAGHGSVSVWRGDIFTSDDAAQLSNGSRLSLFVIMDCLNGLFHDPRIESLASALVKAGGGGAVAVWASSGLTEPNGQAVMDQALLPLLFQRLTLGEASVIAKRSVADPDIRRTWILFGDPTTRLRN